MTSLNIQTTPIPPAVDNVDLALLQPFLDVRRSIYDLRL